MQDSIFIGLDVHKAAISVAIARGERGGEVRHWGTIPHRSDHVRKLVARRRPQREDASGSSVSRRFRLFIQELRAG